MTMVFPMYVGVILKGHQNRSDIGRIPHVCGGDPFVDFDRLDNPLVFPMYVGVILVPGLRLPFRPCIPHVCGGDPAPVSFYDQNGKYSPCMWG